MPLYEHVYLARQDVSAQQVEDLTKQFTTVIEGLGGKVTKAEYWGVKSLNFRIRKHDFWSQHLAKGTAHNLQQRHRGRTNNWQRH